MLAPSKTPKMKNRQAFASSDEAPLQISLEVSKRHLSCRHFSRRFDRREGQKQRKPFPHHATLVPSNAAKWKNSRTLVPSDHRAIITLENRLRSFDQVGIKMT